MVKQIPSAVFPAKVTEPQSSEVLVDPQRRITANWHCWTVMVDTAIRRFAGFFTFLALDDTPDSYSGQALKVVRVNAGETGLEFVAASAIAPLAISFILNTGATGTNVGPELRATRAGSFAKCTVTVKASDPSVVLTFKIKKNGTDIFSADPSLAGGTAGGTITAFTSLTSSPLTVALNDLFTIDISSGNANWAATIDLE